MTKSELESLRDVSPSFGYDERIIDGQRVRVAVQQGECGALFQKPDDGVFPDARGDYWMTGWLNGEHVRRRFG